MKSRFNNLVVFDKDKLKLELDKFERPIVSFDTYNINVLKKHVLSDEETLTTNAIINPIYFQEKNMFMAGFIDYINNIPCFVFFTFEENKITG